MNQFRVVYSVVDLGVAVSHHCEKSILICRTSETRKLSEVECWEDSTNAKLRKGEKGRSDKSPLSPTTLGSYNNWFQSYVTSPREDAIVLCGQDLWRTHSDHSSVQLCRVLAKGETTSDVDDRFNC